MSEDAEIRFVVVNRQNQPLELYLTDRVLVLPPRGRAHLEEIDLAGPQLGMLRQARLIMVHREEVAPSGPASEASGEAADTPADDGSEQPEQTTSDPSKTGRRSTKKAKV